MPGPYDHKKRFDLMRFKHETPNKLIKLTKILKIIINTN